VKLAGEGAGASSGGRRLPPPETSRGRGGRIQWGSAPPPIHQWRVFRRGGGFLLPGPTPQTTAGGRAGAHPVEGDPHSLPSSDTPPPLPCGRTPGRRGARPRPSRARALSNRNAAGRRSGGRVRSVKAASGDTPCHKSVTCIVTHRSRGGVGSEQSDVESHPMSQKCDHGRRTAYGVPRRTDFGQLKGSGLPTSGLEE